MRKKKSRDNIRSVLYVLVGIYAYVLVSYRMEKTTSPKLAEGTGLGDANEFLFSSGGPSIEDRDSQLAVNEPGSRQLSSWAEYFGVQAVTVTQTLVHFVTVKYRDPNTVIIFDVKGCRPTQLPFNLSLCSDSASDSDSDSDGSSTIDDNAAIYSHPVNSLTKQVHYVP